MTARILALALLLHTGALFAEAYKSPYKVEFTFKDEELIGDLLKGPRADFKDEASVPFREWYSDAAKKRWGYWGPGARHFEGPPGAANKGAEWMRQRVIATGLRFAGYGYQHHHVPDWEPPADWPKEPKQTSPAGKGLDCSNFTAFVYNLALGIKPTGEVQDQAVMTGAPGPGASRTTAAKRIELPEHYEDFERVLQTGDLLFVKSRAGNVSHVVLWVGKIGKSRDGVPLILDSTGTGSTDSDGTTIPEGVNLRPFKRNTWYSNSASHALRLIPEGK